MNDRLPGSCWGNPIWHREKWRIYVGDSERLDTQFCYCHDDYDGAPDARDGRFGHGTSIEDCKRQIDEEFYDEV